MIAVLGGLIGGLLDPLTAGAGIAAALLWRRHRGWSVAVLVAFGAFCFGLRLMTANAFHERFGPYPFFSIAAAVIWMLPALGLKAMFSPGSSKPPQE